MEEKDRKQKEKKLKVLPISEEKTRSQMDEGDRLRTYCKWIDNWYGNFNQHLERARNYLYFLYIDGWDLEERRNRETQKKPALTFNKITPIVRGILGQQRINSPQLIVKSTDMNTPQNWLDWRNDHLRYIAYASNSDVAYQTGFKGQLEIGWGAWEVTVEYENSNTLKKCIRIKEISDYQVPFWDPKAIGQHKEDGDYCGKYWHMSKADYDRQYPDSPDPESLGNNYYFLWDNQDGITGCDLYYKEYYKKTICRLSNGEEMELSEANDVLTQQKELWDNLSDQERLFVELKGVELIEIVEKAQVLDFRIIKVRMVRNHILEETTWPGKIFPIPYVEGDSTVLDGEKKPVSYIQDVIDTQKLINYYGSEVAYSVLMARREQYIVTPGNVKGFEQQWKQPQNVQGALRANPDPVTGQMPIPVTPLPFNSSLLQAQQDATSQIAQVLGRYEEARGDESNAMSGVAINARQRAANLPVNVFEDNLQRAIKHTGDIILDLMDIIYDGEMEIPLRNAQGDMRTTTVNKMSGVFNFTDDGDFEEEIQNPVGEGNYTVECRVDGSFDAQRLQQLDTLFKFAQIFPPMAPIMPDLISESSGLEIAQKLTERAKTLLPPDIKAMESGEPAPPPQPDPMMQLQQQKMELEQKSMELKNQEMMINMQLKQKQMELDEIKFANDRTKMILDAQQHGLDAKLAQEQTLADIHTTHAKANAEIAKGNLALETANVVHHTHRMKEIGKLIPRSNEGGSNV